MSFLLKKSFHTDLGQRLVDDIQLKRANYFYFLGRVAEWNESDTPPESIVDDLETEIATRSDIVSVKKITPTAVSFVIPRIDWVTGSVYDQYDSGIDMTGKRFYVITNENNVYKCLCNNSDSFSPTGYFSTVQPTGVSTEPLYTADGYIWKYMYSVHPYKKNKFMTTDWIPVQRALTDRFYSSGAVDSVVVTNPGSGYVDTPTTFISISGDGINASVIPVISRVDGRILDVIVTNSGSSYTTASFSITTTSSTVESLYTENTGGAVLEGVISEGKLVRVNILDPGLNYSFSNKYSVVASPSGTGTGAQLTPIIVGGTITAFTIVSGGSSYTNNTIIKINSVFGSGAILQPNIVDGSIISVTIINGGYQYDSNTFSTVFDGASFVPVIYDGKVQDIIVEYPGIGYSSLSLNIIGDNGSGTDAEATAFLSDSDLKSDQASVEHAAVIGEGAIYSIVITNIGSGYTSAPAVTITGDGTGCLATVTDFAGGIIKITVTEPGTGYSYANVTIAPNNVPNSIQATARAIISPMGGHGKDAVSELGANTVCIYSNIKYDTLIGYNISQDFREYGIIKNFRDPINNALVTADYAMTAYVIEVLNNTSMILDEILVNGSSKFRVVDKLSDTSTVIVALTNDDLSANDVLLAESELEIEVPRSYTVQSITYSPSSVDKYTGQMLFVSDSDAFTFTTEQEITIKTFLTL